MSDIVQHKNKSKHSYQPLLWLLFGGVLLYFITKASSASAASYEAQDALDWAKAHPGTPYPGNTGTGDDGSGNTTPVPIQIPCTGPGGDPKQAGC